jgi:5'-nucleotidase
MKKQFDLVISGINRGLNIGRDTIYSGTVGAIFEANALGVPALAFSTSPAYYDRAIQHLDGIYDFICSNQLMEKNDLYNINIPNDPVGFRITRQGGPYYSDDFKLDEDGMCIPHGICVHQNNGDLQLDTDATVSGYISILPMTADITNWDVYRELCANGMDAMELQSI